MKKIISLLLIATVVGCGNESQVKSSSGISVTLDKDKLIEYYQIFNGDVKKSIETYKVLEEKYGAINNILDKAKTGDADAKTDLETIINISVSIQTNSNLLQSSYQAIKKIQTSSNNMENNEKIAFEKFKTDINIEEDKVNNSLREMPRLW